LSSSNDIVEPDFANLIRYIQESRGIDFRGYKKSSLCRRVTRRMEDVGSDSFAAYHALLEADPREFNELLNTVLINVTSFFRDTEAWMALRNEVVPAIVERSRQHRNPIRVWSIGCASGEEPFSVAMAFAEVLGVEAFCDTVKVYATDLDEEALRTARHATYTPRDVEALPPELLERYFERVGNNFVFQRELRKCVIFGRHNVVHDAPISRIDLLICRNLLIYLEAETQDSVLPRLHYALVDGGYMFLGKAETQLARSRLFESVDLKHRLFRKLPQEWRRSSGGSLSLADTRQSRLPQQVKLVEAITDTAQTAYLAVGMDGRLIYANVAARRLLEVGEGDIGRVFQDLSVSYRPTELRSRIDEAQRVGRSLRIEHQEYHRPPADPMRLTIEITPLYHQDKEQFATLISFTDTTKIYQLQQELEAAQESLETTIEELQSANEELETTNEELQSTNEELETTNEELQSTNEELETMNEELRSANEEMEGANEELRRYSAESSDYRRYSASILRSMDVGIIVVNQSMQLRSWNRWNENAWGLRSEEVIGENLLSLDIGLPMMPLLGRIQAIINGDEAQAEFRVDGLDRRGRSICCKVRIFPLLYEDRQPQGAVLILEDVTETVRNEEFVHHLGRIVGESLNEIYFLEPGTLRFLLVNRGAEQKLGYTTHQLLQMSLPHLMPGVSMDAIRGMIRPLLAGERSEVVFETKLQGRERSYPAEICLQYFNEEQPPMLLALVHDTTEREQIGASADG
jgi:two-component system CheB/CheR fusion protein